MVKAGEFPAPIRISAGAVAWPSSTIDQWIEDRIKASSREGLSEVYAIRPQPSSRPHSGHAKELVGAAR